MKLRRGDEINLYVRSLEKATRFYVRALDFELCEQAEDDSYRKLQNGDVNLTLFVTRSVRPAAAIGAVPSMSMDLYVDDIDDALDFFFATDGRILKALDQDTVGWITDALRDALAPYAEPAVRMPASSWLVTARA